MTKHTIIAIIMYITALIIMKLTHSNVQDFFVQLIYLNVAMIYSKIFFDKEN
jgi:hypothetical protein